MLGDITAYLKSAFRRVLEEVKLFPELIKQLDGIVASMDETR